MPRNRKNNMPLRNEIKVGYARWRNFDLYPKFEHAVVLMLAGLTAVVVASAVWSLTLKVVSGLVLAGSLDPTDHAVFQSVFGMIFTVIIALEFKRTLWW
jgi:phosphate-starvation-inducible protein E